MAEDGMSIVPYTFSNLDVVLRHNDSVVVRDRNSQQLALRNVTENSDDLEPANCPYCHRPMRDANGTRITHRVNPNHGAQHEFINPNYFRMLHDRLPSSADPSHPLFPRRGLAQPVLANGPTSDPSSSQSVPTAQGISSAAFAPNYFQRFFVEERILGKGGKGVALLVNHVLDGVSLGHYACKRVPVGDDHQWLERVLGEVQLLQHLSHQNLVSYRHVWLENAKVSTFGPSVPCAFILQQYCNAGDLQNYIGGSVQTSTTPQQLKERLRRRSKGEPEPPVGLAGPRKLQLDEIYSFFKDITSGLRYLHVNGYIHRDLKPSNCLLHETSDGLRVLVSDFGEVQSQDSVRGSTGATGTVSYCAPEVLRREYPGGPFGNFSFKSDIFSLGMTLYFMCFAQLPYKNAEPLNEEKEDLDQLREEIIQWPGFDDARRMRPELPEKLYAFLERLLSVDPSRRPSAEDVLSGIQAGVNANESVRFKKTNSTGSDLHLASRIQTVSALASTPTSQSARSPGSGFSLAPPTRRRGSILSSSHNVANSSAVENIESNGRLRLESDGDLVGSPTPSKANTRAIQQREPFGGRREESAAKRQLLPPPPSHLSILGPPGIALDAFSALALRLGIFLAKAVSVSQPCTPVATNPWILYPTVLLATISFGAKTANVQGVFLAVHMIIVVFSIRLGALCVQPL